MYTVVQYPYAEYYRSSSYIWFATIRQFRYQVRSAQTFWQVFFCHSCSFLLSLPVKGHGKPHPGSIRVSVDPVLGQRLMGLPLSGWLLLDLSYLGLGDFKPTPQLLPVCYLPYHLCHLLYSKGGVWRWHTKRKGKLNTVFTELSRGSLKLHSTVGYLKLRVPLDRK